MKIIDKPVLYRTITTQVVHRGKSYDIYIKEDINCTNYEIREIDENGDVEEYNGLSKQDGLSVRCVKN